MKSLISVDAASPERRTVLYVEPSVVASHSSPVSFQRRATFVESPRSISIPAFSVGDPVALELRVMMLSAREIVSVLTVVVVPETVRSPFTTRSLLTVRSFPIVTSSGNPTVIAPTDADTSISFAVPVRESTADPESRIAEIVISDVPSNDADPLRSPPKEMVLGVLGQLQYLHYQSSHQQHLLLCLMADLVLQPLLIQKL